MSRVVIVEEASPNVGNSRGFVREAPNINANFVELYGAQGPILTLAAARTLLASENGAMVMLDLAGGFTVTLPARAAGLRFRFIVKTSPTTAYIILAPTGDEDTIVGWPINCGGADSVANGNAAGDQVNFVANTALAGDQGEIFCDGTSWHWKSIAKAIGAVTITG